MARRYGKLPTDILSLDMQEFNINLAICYKALLEENKQMEEEQRKIKQSSKYNKPVRDGNKLSFGGFNIKRNVNDTKKVKK